MNNDNLLSGDDLLYNFDGSENKTKKKNMEILLKNLYESKDNNFPALIKIARRVFPSLLANEIMDVQASNKPVQLVNVYRFGEKTEINPDGIVVVEEPVETKHVKYQARYYMEVANKSDPDPMKEFVENEVVDAISAEITAETNISMINHINNLVGQPTVYFDEQDDETKRLGYVGDVHSVLGILINRKANLISARTRRGTGNWCVVSPTALTILQSATGAADTFSKKDNNAMNFVGILNNSINVYCDPWGDRNSAAPVIVGYKGNLEGDSGLIYSPYMQVMSKMIVDPLTYELFLTLSTRYGLYEMEEKPEENFYTSAKDYYASIGIKSELSFI